MDQASCQFGRVRLSNNADCTTAQKILSGKIVKFGPDLVTMENIVSVCRKLFRGFMDERFVGIPDVREYFFKTSDGYDCFKPTNHKGERQGKWGTPARDLGRKAWLF